MFRFCFSSKLFAATAAAWSLVLAPSSSRFGGVAEAAEATGYLIDKKCIELCADAQPDETCTPDNVNVFYGPEGHTGWCLLLQVCIDSGYVLMSESPGDDGKHSILLDMDNDASQPAVLSFIEDGTKGPFPLVTVEYDDAEAQEADGGVVIPAGVTLRDTWATATDTDSASSQYYSGAAAHQVLCQGSTSPDLATNNMCFRSDVLVAEASDDTMYVIESNGCPDHANMQGSSGRVPDPQGESSSDDGSTKCDGGKCTSCGSGACAGGCAGGCGSGGCDGCGSNIFCDGGCASCGSGKCDGGCVGCGSEGCDGGCAGCGSEGCGGGCAGCSSGACDGGCAGCDSGGCDVGCGSRFLQGCDGGCCGSCGSCGADCGSCAADCGSCGADCCGACGADCCGACGSCAAGCGSCCAGCCGACAGCCGTCGSVTATNGHGHGGTSGKYDPKFQHYRITIPKTTGEPGEPEYFTKDDEVVGILANGILLDNHKPTWSYDSCNGHSDTKHMYHYHIPPRCLLEEMGVAYPEDTFWWKNGDVVREYSDMAAQWPANGEPSPVLGFALDGYPIFGPYDDAGNLQRGKGFGGDVDECNGKVDAEGNYGYYLTVDPPFAPPCLRGEKGIFTYHKTNLSCPKDGIQTTVLNTAGGTCANTAFSDVASCMASVVRDSSGITNMRTRTVALGTAGAVVAALYVL